MQFDAALAAQTAFHHAEDELGADWETAVALEEAFSSQAGHAAIRSAGASDAIPAGRSAVRKASRIGAASA